jgi:hypothetical protein
LCVKSDAEEEQTVLTNACNDSENESPCGKSGTSSRIIMVWAIGGDMFGL